MKFSLLAVFILRFSGRTFLLRNRLASLWDSLDEYSETGTAVVEVLVVGLVLVYIEGLFLRKFPLSLVDGC